VWAGLVRKAEDAAAFIAAMTRCTVLERTGEGLVREVVVHGERLRERVVIDPKRKVTFIREDADTRWLIDNEIGRDEAGELTLTFTGVVQGAAPAAANEQQMRESLAQAAGQTVAVIRRAATDPTVTRTTG
jgi:ABC-type phosphonate transport system ATPase subunit